MARCGRPQEIVTTYMTPEETKIYTRKNTLRLPTFDYAAARIYFVTIVTTERRRFFNNPVFAEAVMECLLSQRLANNFNLYVACLMPDHLHVLIGLKQESKSLGQIIGAFKSLSTRIYWEFGEGILWQRQYHDHIIRNDKDLFETFEYIKANPVRKGLVEAWDQWPHTKIIDEL